MMHIYREAQFLSKKILHEAAVDFKRSLDHDITMEEFTKTCKAIDCSERKAFRETSFRT